MPRFVVWISELDSRLSKRFGREVPKNIAVEAPELWEILDAVKEIDGIKVLYFDEALNPRISGVEENLKQRGRVFVESQYSKSRTLKLVAEKIRSNRKRKKDRRKKTKVKLYKRI